MTDPYADFDPSRGRWIWWAVGLYGVSFLVPTVPLWNSGSFSLGIHLFAISFIIFVAGLINPGIWGSERDATSFLLFGLPWLANPLLWWCLVAWADGRRRTAAVTGLLAFLCGLAGIFPGFIFAPYWVWMASLALPSIGLAMTHSAVRNRLGGAPTASPPTAPDGRDPPSGRV